MGLKHWILHNKNFMTHFFFFQFLGGGTLFSSNPDPKGRSNLKALWRSQPSDKCQKINIIQNLRTQDWQPPSPRQSRKEEVSKHLRAGNQNRDLSPDLFLPEGPRTGATRQVGWGQADPLRVLHPQNKQERVAQQERKKNLFASNSKLQITSIT